MKNAYETRGDTVAIFIRYRGGYLETVIDKADFDKANQFSGRWRAVYSKTSASCYCWGQVGKTYYGLHRLLMDAPKGMDVDHINHDTLDNQRQNLRVLSRAANLLNRRGSNSNNLNGHLGVCFHKACVSRPWQGRIILGRENKSLGYYATPEEAAAVVAEARKRLLEAA